MVMNDTITRRGLVVAAGATALLGLLPRPAAALDTASARALIDMAIGDVNKVINSGKPEPAMYKDFEGIFARYADVPAIARSALGPAARGASAGQMSAFTKAYQGYIGRKYGRRFREFIGGRIEVVNAKPLKCYYEVISVAHLQGEAPFDLRWHVSNKSGKDLFFNIIIEGVNMLATEREEVAALLKQRGGDIDRLVADLKTM